MTTPTERESVEKILQSDELLTTFKNAKTETLDHLLETIRKEITQLQTALDNANAVKTLVSNELCGRDDSIPF